MKHVYPVVLVAILLACIPKGQSFNIEHPQFAKAHAGFTTYQADFDGIKVTLNLSADRPGLFRLSVGLQNLLDTKISYDISSIGLVIEARTLAPTWYSGGCCKEGERYVCSLEHGDCTFCTILFDAGNVDSISQEVEIQLGSVIVDTAGAQIRLGSVPASRATDMN